LDFLNEPGIEQLSHRLLLRDDWYALLLIMERCLQFLGDFFAGLAVHDLLNSDPYFAVEDPLVTFIGSKIRPQLRIRRWASR